MPDIITLNHLAEILGIDLNYFSEDIEPKTTESDSYRITPVESSENQSAELQSGNQKKRLSWNMSQGNWVDADFSGLKNLHEKFGSSNMQRCKLIGSDLSGLHLKSNNVDSCDFSGSDISNSHIHSSLLNNNTFKDCSLKGTEFSGSYIYGCDFTGADFTDVVIKSGGFSGVVAKSGDLEKNTIINTMWNHTSFIDTQIADIVLTGKLEDCSFENCAFTRVKFRDATLINTFFKNNKKLKRIRFFECKADRMTYEFLKQGKADLTGITLMTQ